jgi:iron(II)-dependent oxidoreductase
MSGNISEWVNDWYDEAYFQTSPSVDPVGPEKGTEKAFRGGSAYDSGSVKVWERFGTDHAAVNIGFRFARSMP